MDDRKGGVGVPRPLTPVDPKKLLLSKWTAVEPAGKEKHFLVVELVEPDEERGKLEFVEIEAVLTQRRMRLPWRALRDGSRWLRGWR